MANTFTPEQIAQILEEFFKVVGTRQYIGARYVPIFGRKDEDSIEWDNTAPYEPLTIVLYQGNSYTSRQYVPIGVEINNQEFWAITGNYNAQIEQYRRETAIAKETADSALETAQATQNDLVTLLPKADFSAENTVKKYVDDSVAEVQSDIDTLLPKADFSAENTVKKYIDAKTDIELELYGMAYSLTAGAFAQSMIYVGNRLFAFGDGVNNAGIMCEISTLTGAIIAEYNDNRIGHPNGACVVDGYIYITNGDKTVYKINPDSLRIENGTSFSVDGPINNLFSIDESIYAVVNQQSIVKLNAVTGTFENLYDIEKYDIPIQGAVYANNRIYIAYTQPNLVRVIDFATGNTLDNKIIPAGDGAFPCNEIESLVYKDGKILVCSSSYINGGYNPQLIANAAFIFDSNIIGDISTHAALSKNIAFNNIFVNSSEASRFKPVSMNFTTALVASIVATYHGSGVIAITNIASNDVMVLSSGKYSVWHYGTGETTLKALYLKNVSATVENLSISDVYTITDSSVTMTLVNIGGVVTIFNSMIHKNLGTFAPTNIAAFRHSIARMDMQTGSDMEAIVARVPAPNQNNVKFYIANNAGVPNVAFINYTNLTCFAYIQLVHEIPFIIKTSDAATYVSTGELIVSTANATYPKIKFTRGANALVSKAATPDVFDTAIDLTIMCTSELR